MSGSTMFAIAWLSIAATVYAWGAVMIVACRALDIRPRKVLFLDGVEPFETWALLAFASVVLLPIAVGILGYDSVQLQREVTE